MEINISYQRERERERERERKEPKGQEWWYMPVIPALERLRQ
jgi:hypothetical protein